MRGSLMEEKKVQRVLVCAATKWEAMPLSRRLGAAVLQTGMGPQNTRRTLSKVPAEDHYDLVISAGFAGALQPGVCSGDIVMDVREAPAEWPPLAREIAQSQRARIHFGRILHSDDVLSSPDIKRKAGQERRACAVDMETAEIRSWAQGRGVQTLPVRVILDAMDDELPGELPEGEGFFSLLRYALARPSQLPGLIKLGMRQRRAIGVLAGFLSAFLETI